MKRINYLALGLSALLLVSCSSVKTDDILTKGSKEGDYIILTDKLTQTEEFQGHEEKNIPLRIYVSQGKITKIEPYDYLDHAEQMGMVQDGLLPKWEGLTIDEAIATEVDAVSGATDSSSAIIKSVKAGLTYAKEKGI